MKFERKYLHRHPSFDPLQHVPWEKYNDDSILPEVVIHPALTYEVDKNIWTIDKNTNILIDVEHPNRYTFSNSNQISELENKFFKILSNCPFSTDWRNKQIGNQKWLNNIFHVVVDELIPDIQEKQHNIFHSGHVGPEIRSNILDGIETFEKRIIVSGFAGDMVTHSHNTYTDKLYLNANSKISITHALFHVGNNEVQYIKNTYPTWKENKAFSLLDKNIMPQIKSRFLEAAFCKTVILHKKDPWNLIEKFLVPNEDFLYYENRSDLIEKGHEILKNYHLYDKMRISAYNKVKLNFTVDKLIETIKKDIINAYK